MVESFIEIIRNLDLKEINMKPKEINQIIQEQTEPFFKQEGFKYSKKDMGYLKDIENAKIRYGFSYVEKHPQYYYQINIYVQLTKIEEIYSKIDGSNILGNTYVFPLSYFLDSADYVNKNPKFLIEKPEDIKEFSDALIDNYKKYVKDFIPKIIENQTMLDFLLSEITTGKRYALNINVLIRTLILLKLNNDSGFGEKLKEFKDKISHYADNIKEPYYKQMDEIASGNF